MPTKALKVIWIACSIAVLAVTLRHDVVDTPNDIGIFLAYGMLILTFPIGFAVSAIIALLAYLHEQWNFSLNLLDRQYVGFSVMWFAFFVAGYWQWFVLLPRLWRKWKTRVSKSRPLSQ